MTCYGPMSFCTPKGHISCTWVQCATFVDGSDKAAILDFSNGSGKHKLGRGRWDLASCQVPLNSEVILSFPVSFKYYLVLKMHLKIAFSKEKSKMYQSIESRGGHLGFPIGQNTIKLWENDEILLPVKFRWIPFGGFREEVENFANQRGQGSHLGFPIGSKHTVTQTW